MKKFAIATAIALAATAASALELGVTATRDYAGADRNFGGVTLGQKYGAVTVTAGVETSQAAANNQDRYSVVAGVDVARLGPVTVAVKAGGAYVNNLVGADGYAALVGVGASVPVTKNVAFTLDATRQYGQDRIQQSDGGRVTAGLKYRF